MEKQYIQRIAGIAMESILFEVSATPKPGLVDRDNSGAHKDMDYFTFMSSASALHHFFDEFTECGFACREHSIRQVLPLLRKKGVEAEREMFAFTNGVNTHKGMIFSMGILCGCVGWAYGKQGIHAVSLCDLAAQMCEGICKQEYADLEKKKCLTKGERMYLEYGCLGIRGEVESAFQTVQRVSLPEYTELRKNGISVNDALVQTLLHLIACTEDTNVLSRQGKDAAVFARQSAVDVLKNGGILSRDGKKMVEQMDQIFIEKNISPGGCADLLAVTHFLYTLD